MAQRTSTVETVNLSTQEELQSAILYYLSQGFVVSSQTPEMTTLSRTPTLNWSFGEAAAAIGLLLLCIVPGVLYMAKVYKSHNLIENLVLRVDPVAAAADAAARAAAADAANPTNGVAGANGANGVSGSNGVSAASAGSTIPPGAPRSDDGFYWWDGTAWQPVDGAGDSPQVPPVAAAE